MSCSVSLTQSISFHGDPKKRTPNLEAKLRYINTTGADKSLHNSVYFYSSPKCKNSQVNLIKKAYRSNDLFSLKLDLDFDLDQLLKWEKRIVSLIESRENAFSPRKFYAS